MITYCTFHTSKIGIQIEINLRSEFGRRNSPVSKAIKFNGKLLEYNYRKCRYIDQLYSEDLSNSFDSLAYLGKPLLFYPAID